MSSSPFPATPVTSSTSFSIASLFCGLFCRLAASRILPRVLCATCARDGIVPAAWQYAQFVANRVLPFVGSPAAIVYSNKYGDVQGSRL
jgi:hypothetical protein